jgi:predicted enzyme related to lactoylglutathione lyase
MTLATWFEIPAVDLERAIAFYEHVFEVALERTEIDGHHMALFPGPIDLDGDTETGASGALASGDSYVPSLDGTRVYFRVHDVAATLRRAIDRGGRELYPVTDIGAEGLVAEFADSEGNRIALSGRSA